MRRNTAADVFAKISIDPKSGCGSWSGAHDPDGYPLIKWLGKTVRAIRLIWTLKHGPIPAGLEVCHRCDNPGCANDEHMFLGTSAQNRADCVAKRRHARGDTHGFHTNPDAAARGERHGSRTHPESLRRGAQHPRYGKQAPTARDEETGRFTHS